MYNLNDFINDPLRSLLKDLGRVDNLKNKYKDFDLRYQKVLELLSKNKDSNLAYEEKMLREILNYIKLEIGYE